MVWRRNSVLFPFVFAADKHSLRYNLSIRGAEMEDPTNIGILHKKRTAPTVSMEAVLSTYSGGGDRTPDLTGMNRTL